MKSIIDQMKVSRDYFLGDICACLGGAVFGAFICLIIYYSSNGRESMWRCGVITLVSFLFAMVLLLFTGIASVPLHFNLAVGMSSTRREYLAGHIAVIMLRFAVVYAVTGIIYLLDGYENRTEIDMSVVFSPVVFAVVAGGTALILFAGACILKFGNKALFGFWAVWLALCLTPARISSDYRRHTGSLFDKIGQMTINIADVVTPVTAVAVGTVIIGILFLISAKMLLKQSVRY